MPSGAVFLERSSSHPPKFGVGCVCVCGWGWVGVMCHVSCVTCHVSCVMCHMSHVTCHMSCVMCHMSHVTCKKIIIKKNFFCDKGVKLVGGGSVINGAYPV